MEKKPRFCRNFSPPEKKASTIMPFKDYIPTAPEHVQKFYADCLKYFEGVDIKNEERELKWSRPAFKNRQYRKLPYTHTGLIAHLGLTDKSEWEKYKTFAEYVDYHRVVKECELVIESQMVDALLTEDMNRYGAEFYLKHKFGMDKGGGQASGPAAIQINIVSIRSKEDLDAYRKAGNSTNLLQNGKGDMLPFNITAKEIPEVINADKI